MTVTITLHREPQRHYVSGGVRRVHSDGVTLWLVFTVAPPCGLSLATIAAIALDEDGGAVE